MRPISAGLRVTLMPHASIRCFWFRPPVHCTGLTFAPLTLASTEARLQDALQHAAHLRRIARDLDAARFHPMLLVPAARALHGLNVRSAHLSLHRSWDTRRSSACGPSPPDCV